MADVRRHKGQSYILRGGRYQRATEEEAAIMDGDPAGVALKSVFAELGAMAELLQIGATAQLAAIPISNRGVNVNQAIAGATDERLARAGALAQQSEQIAELNPAATDLAQGAFNVIDIASLGSTALLRRGGREVASSLAERASRDIQALADESAPGVPGGTVGVPAPAGSTSVGAAQAAPVRGVGKLYRAITDRFENGPKFSADQFEILETRLYAEVGFEFPPGSLDDPGLFAAYLANPLMRGPIDPVLDANARRLGDFAIRALQLDPADFPRGLGRGVLSAARKKLGAGFNQVGKDVGTVDLTEIADDIAPLLNRGSRNLLKDSPDNIAGPELMRIRSRLNKQLDTAHRNDPQLALSIEDSIDSIDEVIADALGPEKLGGWRDLQESWRTFKAFERPGSVDQKTGDLSLKSLTLNLQRQYRTFAEASPDELNTIPLRLESTRNLLKFSRVARSFSDSVADSGTPTRSTLAALAENPKAAVRFRMLAGALEDASRGPEEALAAAR